MRSSQGGTRPGIITDYGPTPFVINLKNAAVLNNNYRTALWTGKHLQITLMSLEPGQDIGIEMHQNLDQLIRIEAGSGMVLMGNSRDKLNVQRNVTVDHAIVIPAGTWHNLVNTGNQQLKLSSVYAPPNHPFGTIQKTKEAAEKSEAKHP